MSVRLDQRALLFSLTVSLLSAIFFGLAPALKTTRTDVISALRTAGAETYRSRFLGRNALVAGQVALSLVLLMVSTFIYRGFQQELGAGPGFRTDHVLMMSFDPSLVRYNEAQTQQFFRQVVERARSVAGVKSATLASAAPMSGENLSSMSVLPEGYQIPKGQENAAIFGSTVDENFFNTMTVRITRGRGFRASDTAATPLVAVINEQLAKHAWPGRDPIGKRFHLNSPEGPWLEVVGVTETTKYLWIAEAPIEFLYLPLAQHPQPQMTLLTQSAGDAAGLAEPLRLMIRELDANQPVFEVRTFDDFYQVPGDWPTEHHYSNCRGDGADGHDPRNGRAVRFGGLRSQPPQPRNRNPHGYRRRARHGAANGPAAGSPAGSIWHRNRIGGQFRRGTIVERDVRKPWNGLRHLSGGGTRAARDYRSGRVHSGSEGVADGSHASAEV